jgi:hypothetical protein
VRQEVGHDRLRGLRVHAETATHDLAQIIQLRPCLPCGARGRVGLDAGRIATTGFDLANTNPVARASRQTREQEDFSGSSAEFVGGFSQPAAVDWFRKR